MKTSNLLTRSITGALFTVLLVGSMLYGPLSFVLLFALISGLSIWEFCTIVNRHAHLQVNRFITTVAGVYLFFAVLGFNLNVMDAGIFIPYILSIVYLLVSELYFDRQNSIQNWAFTMMAQLYVALPFALLNTLSFVAVSPADGITTNGASIAYTWVYTLSVFIFLWSSDSGAYCFGSMLGKHRLFPRISPKKSWEGSIGGGIVALIASQILATYFPDFAVETPLQQRLAWAGLALIVVIFGTWGDLVESLLKRKLNIKDSGNILPGHGGMLDRFDSSLLAIPMSVVYIYSLNTGAFSKLIAIIFG